MSTKMRFEPRLAVAQREAMEGYAKVKALCETTLERLTATVDKATKAMEQIESDFRCAVDDLGFDSEAEPAPDYLRKASLAEVWQEAGVAAVLELDDGRLDIEVGETAGDIDFQGMGHICLTELVDDCLEAYRGILREDEDMEGMAKAFEALAARIRAGVSEVNAKRGWSVRPKKA